MSGRRRSDDSKYRHCFQGILPSRSKEWIGNWEGFRVKMCKAFKKQQQKTHSSVVQADGQMDECSAVWSENDREVERESWTHREVCSPECLGSLGGEVLSETASWKS